MMSELSAPCAHIAYVLNGPICEKAMENANTLILKKLIQLAKELPICELILQPAMTHSISIDELARLGFEQSDESLWEPKATVLLDLTSDTERLLRDMKPRTRANIRRSGRGKLVIMEGSHELLPSYYGLLQATAERRGFSPLPYEVIKRILVEWVPNETVRLFLVKYNDELVAGQIVVACGDTAVNLLSVWSGSYGREKPNDAVQWHTIRWAKKSGYKWYDLHGIDLESGESASSGRKDGDVIAKSFSKFKLGYGGKLVQRPQLLRLNLCSKWQRAIGDVSTWLFRWKRSLRY